MISYFFTSARNDRREAGPDLHPTQEQHRQFQVAAPVDWIEGVSPSIRLLTNVYSQSIIYMKLV